LTGVPERPFEIQPDRGKIAPSAAFAVPRRSAPGVGDVGSTIALICRMRDIRSLGGSRALTRPAQTIKTIHLW
jgi:hypothetical protein